MMADTQRTDETDKRAPRAPRRTVATFRHRHWLGWMWGVPVAAVAIVLWLLLRTLSASGTNITITFNEAAGMSPDDTHVLYRGLKVGTLRNIHLDASGQHVIAQFNIEDSAKRWLTTGTRFYLEGAHPSLSNLASLKAIISGPSIILVPGGGDAAHRFVGIMGPAPQPFEASVSYRVLFDGAVGNLDVGAPVTLRGFVVGDVTQVSLHVDAASGNISTPVTIALDPTRFHMDTPAPAKGDWAPVLDATLTRMVAGGLRAALTQSPPLIGGQQVALELRPDAPPATLTALAGQRPAIPTAPASAGPAQLIAKLDKLPVDAIADNVRVITNNVRDASERVDELVNSPQLSSSLAHLNSSLATLDRTLRDTAPQIAPTIESLRATAQQIDATARSAQQLVGGSSSSSGNVQEALQELTRTARAIRSLADYLERHPNAFITGR